MTDVHQKLGLRISTLTALCVALAGGAFGCSSSNDNAAADGGAGEVVLDNNKIAADDKCNENSTERCTDKFGLEVCPVDSGWEGDGLHPCEDKPDTMILHYGPKNYDDQKEIDKFTMPAQSEDENCVFVESPNDADVYLGTYHGRMRPYSHHLIVTLWDKLPDGVKLGEPTACNQFQGVGTRWLLGSQDPQIDLERGGAVVGAPKAQEGDPDYKLGTRLPPHQYLRIDMHYINSTDKPILREGWVYLQLVPKSDVKTTVDMITFFQGSINVPAGAKNVTTKMAKCVAPTDRYIGLVTGHFHQNGTRFSVWHDTAEGDHKLVYETYDWENPGNAYYADRVKLPTVDHATNQWGAQSGYLHVKKGEAISFQCEFDNPTDTTVKLGETGKDQMCNVFGMYYPSDGDNWNCTCAGSTCF
jgi:hypothetical protein